MLREFEEHLKRALKNRDHIRVSILRLIISELKNAQLSKKKDELQSADVIEVLTKLKRKHEESIDAFKKGQRDDLVQKEALELKVIEEFLPKPLSREEIEELAKKAIQELNATSPKDMGKVMAKLKDQYMGRADGKEVSEVVRSLLEKMVIAG